MWITRCNMAVVENLEVCSKTGGQRDVCIHLNQLVGLHNIHISEKPAVTHVTAEQHRIVIPEGAMIISVAKSCWQNHCCITER